MWQTDALQRSLDGIDGHGARPVLRSAPPSALTVPTDVNLVNRRHQRRRQSDSKSGRSRPRELATAAACAALDCIDIAIILLHPDRRVLLSNAAALRTQARGDCFRVRAERLKLTDRHSQHELETFLSNGVTAPSLPRGPICVAGRDNGSSCYFLFAEWLDFSCECDGVAAVQIHEPRRAGQLDPDLLGRLYQLTRMESLLAATLYSTPILQIAADQCGISLNTAKTHLKHVFSKCAVHSKSELLRMLALGPRTS